MKKLNKAIMILLFLIFIVLLFFIINYHISVSQNTSENSVISAPTNISSPKSNKIVVNSTKENQEIKVNMNKQNTTIIYETDSLISLASSMLITIVAIFISLALLFYWQANETLFNLVDRFLNSNNDNFSTKLLDFWENTQRQVRKSPHKIFNFTLLASFITVGIMILLKIIGFYFFMRKLLSNFNWIDAYYLFHALFIIASLVIIIFTLFLLKKLTKIYSFHRILFEKKDEEKEGLGLFKKLKELSKSTNGGNNNA